MNKSEFTFQTSDGEKIAVYKHKPKLEIPKAVIIIVHGMAEHAQRYDNFASFLNENNYLVYAYDQRGHGKTAGSIERLGFFAEKDGWNKVVYDLKQLIDIAKKENENIPVFLLGHSMGSFVVRTFITKYGNLINGAILSGTAGSAGLLGKIGTGLTKIISALKGKKHPSPLMDNLSFGDFNKNFKPNRTKFDWLSRDNDTVDKYVNDPYCGTIFSVGFFYDMMTGLEYVNDKRTAQNIPSELPVYLFSGGKDPVSKNAKQIEDVYNMYKTGGIKNIKLKIYPEARHETLNEINKLEVYNDVINWLSENI